MTKRLCFILVCCCALWCACSTDDSVAGIGGDILGGDSIVVRSDTFSYSSSLANYDYILSSPDSFLLGELETNYGVVRGEILTQVACPVGFSYPKGKSFCRVDSVCLFMNYGSCVGDVNAPLALDVYEMDRATLTYSKSYKTNVDVSKYCSLSPQTRVLSDHRIVVASGGPDSVTSVVRCRLSDDFAERFACVRDFSSQAAFNEAFKGLYLKTSFGGATMLHVTDICLAVYYSFDYQKTYADGSTRDTIVSDVKGFYANTEVRTINRFECANAEVLMSSLGQDPTYQYIIAPAGVYTRVAMPLAQMAEAMHGNLSGHRAYVNLAELRFDVHNMNTISSTASQYWLQPASYMLLVRESSLDRFFSKHELPSDTCAILASISTDTDPEGNKRYYYSYDLSTLLTQQLRQDNTVADTLRMVLVPVSVSLSGTNAISGVKQLQTLSATQISPSDIGANLHVIYSGF